VDVGFLLTVTRWEYVSAYPIFIPMTSSSPGSWPNEPILWLKVLLDPRLKYELLEPLIDFLAFLVPKWCQKFQIFQEFAEKFPGFP